MARDYNNAPGRLLKILRSVPQASQSAGEVWQQVLNIPSADRNSNFETYRRLAELDRLAEETVELVHATVDEEKRELYLRSLPEIRAGIRMPLEQTWNGVVGKFAPLILQGLEFCASACPEEEAISEDELAQIRNDFGDLFNHVHSSDLKRDLKKWLLALLSEAKRAMDLFDIHGARAFKNALKEVAGELVLHQTVFHEAKSSDKKFGEGFYKFFSKLVILAKRYKGVKPILQDLGKAMKWLAVGDMSDVG